MRFAVKNGREEQDLAAACSRKDRLAEEELYTRYAARVYTLCRRYTGSTADAEDLLQETFIKVLDTISSFRYKGKGSLQAWISRIAVNTAIDRIRSSNRLPTIPLDFSAAKELADEDGERVERLSGEVLLELISRLPDLRRTVFNLYCIDGYSHKEIGKLLEISEKGSAGILAKARRQLRQEMDRYLKETEI